MNFNKYIWGLRALIYGISFNKIGKLSYIGKPTFIEGRKNISLGNKVRIYPSVRMEAIGNGKIIVGNNVAIEQNVEIVSMEKDLCIGNDVTIAGNVFISNVNHDYRDIKRSVMDQGYIVKKTTIGDGCFIGFGVVILPGTILGKHCVVGSNAVLTGKYEDFSVIVGAPARVIKQYDVSSGAWKGLVNAKEKASDLGN